MSVLKKGVPNDALGAKVNIKSTVFPSIAQASRKLGHSRKLIRTRIDSQNFPEWNRIFDI